MNWFLLILIILVVAAAVLYIYYDRKGMNTTKELNSYIDDYNAKYSANIPHVHDNMRMMIAAQMFANKNNIKNIRDLVDRFAPAAYNLVSAPAATCAADCAGARNCRECCQAQCEDSSELENCFQHCANTGCGGICKNSTSYSKCRNCCERNCNINNFAEQMDCKEVCDDNFEKEYSSCADQCSDDHSLADCEDCCMKNCNAADIQLCLARCNVPMLRFISFVHNN